MDIARQKLEKHRDKAIGKGQSASEYAATLGLSPQRIAKLIAGKTEPTLREAYAIKDAVRINPALWLN